MPKNRRKTKVQDSLSIENAREVVTRIKQLEGMSEHTLSNYEKLFNDLERCFSKKKFISNFTKEDARKFIEWQLNEKEQFKNARWRKDKKIGVSVSSANSYLQYAKAAFSTLKGEGYLDVNVWDGMKNIKQQQKQVETLTEDEIKRILNSLNRTWFADFRCYVMLHTLLDSFGRITETLSIKKQDIDFEKGTITFNKTKNKLFRIVPVSKKTLNLLQQLILECAEFESEYVFLTNTGKELTGGTVRKQLKEVIEKAGVDRRVYPHLFRHTASKFFLERGGSVRVLQKILGHRDIQTTMIYAHTFESTIKEQHEQYSMIKHLNESQGYKTRISNRGRPKNN